MQTLALCALARRPPQVQTSPAQNTRENLGHLFMCGQPFPPGEGWVRAGMGHRSNPALTPLRAPSPGGRGLSTPEQLGAAAFRPSSIAFRGFIQFDGLPDRGQLRMMPAVGKYGALADHNFVTATNALINPESNVDLSVLGHKDLTLVRQHT